MDQAKSRAAFVAMPVRISRLAFVLSLPLLTACDNRKCIHTHKVWAPPVTITTCLSWTKEGFCTVSMPQTLPGGFIDECDAWERKEIK